MDKIFVSCAPGIEDLLAIELKELGIPSITKEHQGIYIPKAIEWVYVVNYCSRLATRVLWPIASFSCIDRRDLYLHASKVNWEQYINKDQTFAVDANVFRNPNLKNSHFAALVVKDALCDQIRNKTGQRPNVSLEDPDLNIYLFLHSQRAVLSIDTSGDPLFKRGYRQKGAIAPLQESLAAALLRISGLKNGDIFCDPCCGSGTILIEAAMMLTKTPSGFFRDRWGFNRLPEYDEAAWKQLKARCDREIIPLAPNTLFGSDRDPQALALCRKNLAASNFSSLIPVQECDVSQYTPPKPPTVIVTNPPYGKRLELSRKTYSSIARFHSDKAAPGCKTFVLTPREDAFSASFGKAHEVRHFFAGGLDVALYTFSND